jgi:hypothetical protein
MHLISLEEVEAIVMSMDPGKSLGLDGFTTNFFHHCWKVVKLDVWALVVESE